MTSPLHVIIIGGGIGGLFAANALRARGFNVAVYGRAAAVGEVGAGVFITPNSMRQLARVGLAAAIERRGARVGRDSRYLRDEGAEIAPGAGAGSRGWNATFGMPRADLVEILSDALPPDVVHTGHRATEFNQEGDVPQVSFANGTVAAGDIVVAADGIHSELRPFVFPPSRPVFSGSVAYRGLVAHAAIAPWPTVAWQMWLRQAQTFPPFSCARGGTGQLRRLRAGGCGDEGILVGAGRPRRAAARVRRLGSAHRPVACPGTDDVPVGALRPRAIADLDARPPHAVGRRGSPDAAAPRPGREPGDRGRHGARDHPCARRPRQRAGGASRLRAIAARARRRRAARRARERPALRFLLCGSRRST